MSKLYSWYPTFYTWDALERELGCTPHMGVNRSLMGCIGPGLYETRKRIRVHNFSSFRPSNELRWLFHGAIIPVVAVLMLKQNKAKRTLDLCLSKDMKLGHANKRNHRVVT